MNTSVNNYDPIEALIYSEDLRIQALDFHKELDLMLIILNTKTILQQSISLYPSLKNAEVRDLLNYKLISNGTGVHWQDLDEDLSLKGFLKDELKKVVLNKDKNIAA